MSRSLVSRVLYTALVLWTTLFMSESEWLVRCPAHDGGSHSSPTPAASDESDAPHRHGSADHSTPSESQKSGHTCSCPGPGCCPPAVAVVPLREIGMAQIVAVHEATTVWTLDLFAEPSEYLHPPATAPPTVALALTA